MQTPEEEEIYGVTNMTTIKRGEFHVRLSDDETEASTWSIADKDSIANPLEREIYGITSKEQIRCKKELSISLDEFVAWWKAIGVHELRQTIEQHVIHFGYLKMHLVSHILKTIWRMGFRDNFTTDISEAVRIGDMKEAYQWTNIVNYIRHMLKYNDYLEER